MGFFLLNCSPWEVQAGLPGCIRTSSLFTTPRNVQAHGVAKSGHGGPVCLQDLVVQQQQSIRTDTGSLNSAFQNCGKVRECGLFTTE